MEDTTRYSTTLRFCICHGCVNDDGVWKCVQLNGLYQENKAIRANAASEVAWLDKSLYK